MRWQAVPLKLIAVPSGMAARGETKLPVFSVTKHRGFVPSLQYFKKQVFSRELSTYTVVEPGEFAYATIHLDEGSIGICSERGLISPMYTVFRVCDSRAYPSYVLRYLKSPWALVQYPRLGKGSVERRKAISFDRLAQVAIPLPPIQEQRRIAKVLALRAKRRAALGQLDALTQSIFLDMFGDPVLNPKNWPLKSLSAVGTVDRGVSKHRPRNAPELLGGPYPFVQTGDVANCDGYIRSFSRTYSEAGLRQSRMWPAGTLCITIAANIAKTGVLAFDACFPDSVVGFQSNERATVEFVRAWLSFLQQALEDRAPESAQKNINLELLRNLPVLLPSMALQRDFAKRIAAAEHLRTAHRASLASLDALFASLQHRAFRGEL
jgi:type I restriction enzyme S subunit